ncbi:MAG: glycosyltransferase family 4 protein [Sandaracinaceae bacterium]|nr:glycosyltransferase family 4 protein [Sandaracinaceae bacterium]
MRRVLMSADSVGGVLSYAEDLCRGLSREGVDVLLAVMGGRLDGGQRAAFEAIGVRVEDSDHALEWMPEPWDEVSEAGVWMLELAERFEPDVVHLNGYAHAALPWEQPVIVVGHSCVASWMEAVHGEPLPDRFALYDRHVRMGLSAAHVVVAPSAFMADALERHYGGSATCASSTTASGWPTTGRSPRSRSCSRPGACGTKRRTCTRSRRSQTRCPGRCGSPARRAVRRSRPASRPSAG